MSTSKFDAVMCLSFTSPTITTVNAYGTATSVVLDIRGYKEKNLLVKNTGGANGLTWNILASLDDGANYDIALKADANVAFGAQEFYALSAYYTHLKVQFKSQVPGSPTTAVVKIAAIGV